MGEDLSASLEYLFRVTTKEVFRYTEKSKVEEIGVIQDDILYLKSRILEGQH